MCPVLSHGEQCRLRLLSFSCWPQVAFFLLSRRKITSDPQSPVVFCFQESLITSKPRRIISPAKAKWDKTKPACWCFWATFESIYIEKTELAPTFTDRSSMNIVGSLFFVRRDVLDSGNKFLATRIVSWCRHPLVLELCWVSTFHNIFEILEILQSRAKYSVECWPTVLSIFCFFILQMAEVKPINYCRESHTLRWSNWENLLRTMTFTGAMF